MLKKYRFVGVVGASGVALSLAFGSCIPKFQDDYENEPSGPPHLLPYSGSSKVGQPIDFRGTSLNGSVRVRLRGVFRPAKGAPWQVDTNLDGLRSVDGRTLRWGGFGPYCPEEILGNCEQPGELQGTLVASVIRNGKEVFDPEPPTMRLKVEPSLVYTDFQPVESTCAKPATRSFGGLTYRAAVKAMGFEPVGQFEYKLETPQLDGSGGPPRFLQQGDALVTQTIVRTHAVQGMTDQVDGEEAFPLPPIPADRQTYGFTLVAHAKDAQGKPYESILATQAKLPVETFDASAEPVLVEVLAADAASGCFTGSAVGSAVSYVEDRTDSKQRQLSLSYDSNFVKTVGTSQGTSESNSFSTSDGKTIERKVENTQGQQTDFSKKYENTKERSNTFAAAYADGTVATASNSNSNGRSNSEEDVPQQFCFGADVGLSTGNASKVTNGNGGQLVYRSTQDQEGGASTGSSSSNGVNACTNDPKVAASIAGKLAAILKDDAQQAEATDAGGAPAQGGGTTTPTCTLTPRQISLGQTCSGETKVTPPSGTNTPGPNETADERAKRLAAATAARKIKVLEALQGTVGDKNAVADKSKVRAATDGTSAGTGSEGSSSQNREATLTGTNANGSKETKSDEATASASKQQATTDMEGATKDVTKGNGSGSTKENTTSDENGQTNGQGFSWDVSTSVMHGTVSTTGILPGQVGVWYRQAVRYQLRTYILLYNKCGTSTVIGTMTMDDWKWSADLAYGPGPCTVGNMPKSKLLSPPVCLLPQEQCSTKAPPETQP